MAVSRILMGRWSHQLRRILEDSNMKLFLLSGYVDDIRMVLEMLSNGQVWDSKECKLVIKEDRKLPAEEWTKEKRIAHTREEMKHVMNSIFTIEFTTEISGDFDDEK